MSKTSKEIILASAQLCFLQFGYQKTSMSLISQKSGFSRVTVHHHFKTKKELFRVLIKQHFSSCLERYDQYLKLNPECSVWNALTYLIELMTEPAFKDINNQQVLNDLYQAIRQVAGDIQSEMRDRRIELIKTQIERGIAEKIISLEKLGTSELELANLINNSIYGVLINSDIDQGKKYIKDLLQTFKVATSTTQLN